MYSILKYVITALELHNREFDTLLELNYREFDICLIELNYRGFDTLSLLEFNKHCLGVILKVTSIQIYTVVVLAQF